MIEHWTKTCVLVTVDENWTLCVGHGGERGGSYLFFFWGGDNPLKKQDGF